MQQKIFQKDQKLRQIAEKYGVSLSTVYRIQRGSGNVKNPVTVQIAQELKKLSSCVENVVTDPLLLVYDNTVTAHTLAFFEAVKKICLDRNLTLVLTKKSALQQELAIRRVAGIISLAPLTSPPPGVPLIYLNRRSMTGNVSAVLFSETAGWLRMIDYLKTKGAKRIGIFEPGNQEAVRHFLVNGNFLGDELQTIAGLQKVPELICHQKLDPCNHAEALTQVADYFLSLPEVPDTILVEVDIYLPRIAKRLKERGHEEIRLACVNNYLSSTPVANNNLTWEYQQIGIFPHVGGNIDFQAMAAEAIDLLLRTIRDPNLPVREVCFGIVISQEPEK